MAHVYFEGVFWILSLVHPWVAMAILLVLLLMIPVGRKILEGGEAYDVSFTSKYGDKGLTIIAFFGAEILHSGPVYVPVLLQDVHTQFRIYLLALLVCGLLCRATYEERESGVMDFFHDLVIAPVFITMALTVGPIILINGTHTQIVVTIGSGILWLSLVYFDNKTGRFWQKRYRRIQAEKRRHFIFL